MLTCLHIVFVLNYLLLFCVLPDADGDVSPCHHSGEGQRGAAETERAGDR